MRMLRPLVLAGTVLLALAPASAQAQEARRFTDSWFWGAKGGLMTFWTPRVNHAPAPLIGVDMLITKRYAALYLAADQAFFKENSIYPVYDTQSLSTDSTTLVPVGNAEAQIRNMRRYTAALMVFPREYAIFRPYAGIGFSLNQINKVSNTGGATGDLQQESLNEFKSGTMPIVILGAQGQVGRVSVFGQGSIIPSRSDFLISGRSTYFIEGGIRYNVGPARERVR